MSGPTTCPGADLPSLRSFRATFQTRTRTNHPILYVYFADGVDNYMNDTHGTQRLILRSFPSTGVRIVSDATTAIARSVIIRGTITVQSTNYALSRTIA